MKSPNELEPHELIQTTGQLLSLGLVISARDYLETLHLILLNVMVLSRETLMVKTTIVQSSMVSMILLGLFALFM